MRQTGKEGPWATDSGRRTGRGSISLGLDRVEAGHAADPFLWSYKPLELLHGLSRFPLDLICS